MYQAIGIIELKSIAKGIEATDAALKSAGIRLVQAHPSCPGKYEIILTGAISDVTAAVEAGAQHAKDQGLFCNSAVIPAPHAELWEQL